MIKRSATIHMSVVILAVAALTMLFAGRNPVQASESANKDKVKVLYHVDGKDPEVAKYALALINKHIDAEGGPENIDVELVVHGPALELFENDKIDPEMRKRFEQAIGKGVHAEMCHNWGYHKLGSYIRKQAIDEMKHAEELIERPACPCTAPNHPLALAKTPGHREDQRHREIGGRIGQDVRRVGHGDAALAGRRHVHGVVADAEMRDHLQLRQPGHAARAEANALGPVAYQAGVHEGAFTRAPGSGGRCPAD